MRLVTFEKPSHSPRLGALLDDDAVVLDLAAAAPGDSAFASMQALIDAGEGGLDRARELCARRPGGALHSRAGVRLRAPLPRPARLRDCGLFIAHLVDGLRELARRMAATAADPAARFEELMASGKFDLNPLFRERVLYYTGDHLSVSGPEDEITAPAGSAELDYELEFAAVIGRTARGVKPDAAREHIFGYTVFNDWSARDIQAMIMPAGAGPCEGKDFADSNTLGPCIVTRDELPDPYSLTMTARVNGEEWSRGTTDGMHHTYEDAVVHLSRDRAIQAGDVLGSGTVPSGTGFDLGKRLRDGDTVELEIEGIGILRNRVRIPAGNGGAAQGSS
ncbi:fumarylacetoacetate hydrolase family protein [Streptomyces sp. AV19]|uniref:fumarylacetoacetate hydrolase family protein n=1 Tax=Streptomyces sp. AV19 TaxID=2793068 RepID=UPI0018FE3590|nr:fumarylacetoacetate hydrolase family protein [Streptomyces sp. AV19]MBH1935434.1 fumarylacetoacetate hydrolase family protein [Streptomyces sp. AV19]MDG4531320.1 fumarylacetoacetate hydrolase family protein [Streptomyces sp. AV19]